MALRFHSTPESAFDGNPSILAVVETVLAISAYGFIGYRYGPLHISVAAIASLLLLLRTAESTQLGLRWGRRVIRLQTERYVLGWESGDYLGPGLHSLPFVWTFLAPAGFVFGFAFWLAVAIITVIIKCLATVATLFRRPLHTLAAIPGNWWRCVACTDSTCPPELLPGAFLQEQDTGSHPSMLVPLVLARDAWTHRERERGLAGDVLDLAFWGSALLALVVPTFAYRASIKGTCLLLSPLVYFVARNAEARAADVRNNVVRKAERTVCKYVLLFIAAKFVYVRLGFDLELMKSFVDLIKQSKQADLLAAYIEPTRFPMWQVAAGLAAVATLIAHVLADSARGKIGKSLDWVMKGLLVCGGMLAVYVMFSLIWIAASHVSGWHFTAVKVKHLPVLPPTWSA